MLWRTSASHTHQSNRQRNDETAMAATNTPEHADGLATQLLLSFYNSTTSTWTLETPRTTWESWVAIGRLTGCWVHINSVATVMATTTAPPQADGTAMPVSLSGVGGSIVGGFHHRRWQVTRGSVTVTVTARCSITPPFSFLHRNFSFLHWTHS